MVQPDRPGDVAVPGFHPGAVLLVNLQQVVPIPFRVPFQGMIAPAELQLANRYTRDVKHPLHKPRSLLLPYQPGGIREDQFALRVQF